MSTTVDPNARTIQPDGLPLVILILSCTLFGLSFITVSLRSYARFAKSNFGLDDVLIIAGTLVYAAATGLSIYGVYVGLGRRNVHLNLWQMSEAMKYYILWILLYVVALAAIKSSICVTILRIASAKASTSIAIYVLLAITWASFFVTFIGTLLFCRPLNAIWMPQLILTGKATCAPVKTLVIIGHVATVSTIMTDLALVVVPGLVLWNTQMKREAKLRAFGLLSFASAASIVTMVRIPYVNKFEDMQDLPFWVAHTMLCSNIELGVGCIASSLPSLRYFFRRGSSTSNSNSGPSNNNNKRTGGVTVRNSFFTIGSEPREQRRFFGDKSLLDSSAEGEISLSSFHQQSSRAGESWDGESVRHVDVPSGTNVVPTTKTGDEEKSGSFYEVEGFHAR